MKQIFSFIIHPETSEFFFYTKTAFIIAFVIFLFITFIFLLKATWLKRRFLEDFVEFGTYRPFGAKKIFKKWDKITKKLASGEESEYKLAIIEADNLLDDTLGKMEYKGETLEEKLEQLGLIILPNIEKVYQVHKIRNNVVYDPDYQLTLDQTKEALEIYEKAFRDLELF